MSKHLPEKIIKRTGLNVLFDREKIENAIYGAALETLQDEKEAEKVSARVTQKVLEKLTDMPESAKGLDVEKVQDIVEEVLMETGHHLTAKNYIIYRKKRAEIRETKSICGIRQDELKLSINAIHVLKKRYLLRDENKDIIESPSEMFRRVARTVSMAEDNFKGEFSREEVEDKFYQIMANLEFLPNSPTLMNAGTPLGQLSACFVLPIEDSIDSIFDTLKNMAKIHQTGGGTGFNFSRIRPKGDIVYSTKGEASGPVSFMGIYDKATQIIIQGGKRRGANMGILRCDHPDILEFIEAKMDGKSFPNFNLSVGITDEFMEAVKKGHSISLINPRNKREVCKIKARTAFDLIVTAAWKVGDPGLIFLDNINRYNPTPDLGTIEATNPCGELPLLAYESCNLASINLSKVVADRKIDWEKFKELIWWGIRFLDDVIEINKFPLPQVKETTTGNRKIGLGIMGFADMLIKLGISYSSNKAVYIAEKIMSYLRQESINASLHLAENRGWFPNYPHSVYKGEGLRLRNATLNTIAPTGSISIIAGCSSGIEPIFALSFARYVLSGTKLFETNPLFEKALQERGLYSNSLMIEVAKSGSIQDFDGITQDLKDLFITTFDVKPEQHLKIQSTFQKYTDNSVSKTINLPCSATIEDIRDIYTMSYKMGCKGITVYRYGSKGDQALAIDSDTGVISKELDPICTNPDTPCMKTCQF